MTTQRKPTTPRKRRAAGASEAGAKGAQAQALKALAPVAKEINIRLEKAGKAYQQGDDHRLAAAIRLAEAEYLCKENKVKFTDWCRANISYDPATVRRLANVGASPDPAKALQDMRERNVANNKAYRERKAAKAAETGSAGRTVAKQAAPTRDDDAVPQRQITSSERALSAFDALPDLERRAFARSAADAAGYVALAKDEAAEHRRILDMSPYDRAKDAVVAMSANEYARFADWYSKHDKARKLADRIVSEASDNVDPLDIPEFLRGDKAPASKPKRSRRKSAPANAEASASA